MLKHFSERPLDAIKHFKDQAYKPLPAFIDPGIFSEFNGIHSAQMAENMLELADIARDVGAKLTERDLDIERMAFSVSQRSKK